MSQDVQSLFLHHADRIRGMALALCRHRDVADDVFQETFLVVVSKAHTFTPGTNFLAWVRAILRLKVLDACRQRRVTSFSPDVMDLLCADTDNPQEAEDQRAEERRLLIGCIGRLAPRAQELLQLAYTEGLPNQELATRLGWSVNAVKVALSRARSFLRRCTGYVSRQDGLT